MKAVGVGSAIAGTIRQLVATSDMAVPKLKAQLQQADVAALKKISQWVLDLDNVNFATRDKAAKELLKCGENALPALEAAARKPNSLEQGRRLQTILATEALADPDLCSAAFNLASTHAEEHGRYGEAYRIDLERNRLVDRMTRRPRHVDWVSGACLLIRRTDLDAVGGFDARFFMYAEDVDLCAAVRARGRSVLFTPEPEVVHMRGKSAASAPEKAQSAYRRSQLAFYAKHHPGWVPFLKIYLKILGRLPDTSK